jgi:ApaG protein
MSTAPQKPFFYRETVGIRITVRPSYLREQSRPAERQYVFVYHVRLENVGTRSAQLISRSWLIHDAAGEDTSVEGDGVVGEQPVIAPGRVHEYRSFCVLKSPNGYMEGHYRFVRSDGSTFDAQIPRFSLAAEASTEGRADDA